MELIPSSEGEKNWDPGGLKTYRSLSASKAGFKSRLARLILTHLCVFPTPWADFYIKEQKNEEKKDT